MCVAVAAGLLASLPLVTEQRTQAVEVAAAIDGLARPGDVVAYCPDQLGPAHSRLIRSDVDQLTFR
jgi:hypothetical protein